jgi:phosphoribulokinase
MSRKHPIVAITGSSGSGITSIKRAFEHIFNRQSLNAFFISGDSFRRYNYSEMKQAIADSGKNGSSLSHYGPEANLFDRLEALFRDYSETGSGEVRQYFPYVPSCDGGGNFSDWEPIPAGYDLLIYEGLHGGAVSHTWNHRHTGEKTLSGRDIDIARYVDLLIGVVPVVNLEWIQKIHNDCFLRGYPADSITDNILNQLDDYISYIVPQFSITDINFQRVPVVDTSNPFIARDVPDASESIVVVHFRKPEKFDFPYMLENISNSFMSRANTLVIPGGYMNHAIDVICTPLIVELCNS